MSTVHGSKFRGDSGPPGGSTWVPRGTTFFLWRRLDSDCEGSWMDEPPPLWTCMHSTVIPLELLWASIFIKVFYSFDVCLGLIFFAKLSKNSSLKKTCETFTKVYSELFFDYILKTSFFIINIFEQSFVRKFSCPPTIWLKKLQFREAVIIDCFCFDLGFYRVKKFFFSKICLQHSEIIV